jgi:hypothetical protein
VFDSPAASRPYDVTPCLLSNFENQPPKKLSTKTAEKTVDENKFSDLVSSPKTDSRPPKIIIRYCHYRS